MLCYQSTCKTPKAARGACPQLAAICAAPWEPCDTRFWQRCDDGWTVDGTSRGGWQGSRAMQVMFVLGLEFALSKSDATAQQGTTRTGLQDDMTFIGSAAAMNRSWNRIEGSLVEAGHRLRGYKCGVWAPGFEQCEDQQLPTEVRDLCFEGPTQAARCQSPWICGEHAILHECGPGPTCRTGHTND